MPLFWVLAAGLAVLVTATLVRALWRPGTEAGAGQRSVYADQLAEIAADRARGTILPDEADRLRAEVARRLLAAERSGAEQPGAARAAGTQGPAGLAAGLAAALVLGGGIGVYIWLGVPGFPDLPLADRLAEAEALRAARPTQAEAEAAARPALERAAGPASGSDPAVADPEFARLIEALRERVAARPDDIRGQRLLAENEALLGNLAAARAAQERVVALAGEAATAADHAELARASVAAAGGVVTHEAEAALARALALDNTDDTALFLAGFGEMQVGRPDRAFRYWRRLVEVAPADSPWLPEVRARIEALAAAAGARYVLPPAPVAAADGPGPSAEDMAAAADLPPEERAAMVRGMVDRLSARLAAEGGTAEEWARLIGALGVLGERDQAAAIWAEAQVRFAGRDADLDGLRSAAVAAGIAE